VIYDNGLECFNRPKSIAGLFRFLPAILIIPHALTIQRDQKSWASAMPGVLPTTPNVSD
jgi:hypothetical protein